jgi:hypothetical protein
LPEARLLAATEVNGKSWQTQNSDEGARRKKKLKRRDQVYDSISGASEE